MGVFLLLFSFFRSLCVFLLNRSLREQSTHCMSHKPELILHPKKRMTLFKNTLIVNGSELKSRCPLKIENEIKTISYQIELNWTELVWKSLWCVWFHFKWLLVIYENAIEFFFLISMDGERRTTISMLKSKKHMFLTEPLNTLKYINTIY